MLFSHKDKRKHQVFLFTVSKWVMSQKLFEIDSEWNICKPLQTAICVHVKGETGKWHWVVNDTLFIIDILKVENYTTDNKFCWLIPKTRYVVRWPVVSEEWRWWLWLHLSVLYLFVAYFCIKPTPFPPPLCVAALHEFKRQVGSFI